MTRSRLILMALGAVLLASFAFLAGCGVGDKANEPFNDAGRTGTNNAPAEIGTMPDGFSNWASKCDGHNRVYTVFKSDNTYGSIAVVANDPRCGG